MPVAYLLEQGSKVRKNGHRLVIEKDEAELGELRVNDLDALALFGNVQLTTQALAELLAAGVPCALLSLRGEYRGRLVGRTDKNVPLRVAQFCCWQDPAQRLAAARAVVEAKIANALAVLERHARNYPDLPLREARETLSAAPTRLATATELAVLRGQEGYLARAYFEGLSRCVRGLLTFTHRSSRPPRDPFNALLSLGYVMVGNEITSLLYAHGFDPYVGLYHDIDYGRPSLALDVLEIFRHGLVDRFVLYLVNNRILGPDDFVSEDKGFRLVPDALKTFLRQYELYLGRRVGAEDPTESLPDWRRAFVRQVEDLARTMQGGGPLRTFRVGS